MKSIFIRYSKRLPLSFQLVLRKLRGPGSIVFKMYILLTTPRRSQFDFPTDLPLQSRRVYIAPANYADQASLLAKALENNLPDLGARNLMSPNIGGSKFEITVPVPLRTFHLSKEWQLEEFKRVTEFTHVLVEAMLPIFGGLYRYNSSSEIHELSKRGLSLAILCHGTDIRNTEAHAKRTPWSPYLDSNPNLKMISYNARKNRDLIVSLGIPVFVTTPDLLDDLPNSHWCPLVISPNEISKSSLNVNNKRIPVVSFAPTSDWIKGSHLVLPILNSLHDQQIINFNSVHQIPKSQMPLIYASSDIILDQFRLGSYGSVAVEGMASGRVVVGHVLPSVRHYIKQITGLELPIVEATPDSLAEVLTNLSSDKNALLDYSIRGIEYVSKVHDGKFSSKMLSQFWIDK